MALMQNLDSANLALIAKHLTTIVEQNKQIIGLLQADVRANDFQARLAEHETDRRLAPYGNSAQGVVDETRNRSVARRPQGFGQGPIR